VSCGVLRYSGIPQTDVPQQTRNDFFIVAFYVFVHSRFGLGTGLGSAGFKLGIMLELKTAKNCKKLHILMICKHRSKAVAMVRL